MLPSLNRTLHTGDRLVRGVLADGAFRFVAGRLTDTVSRTCLVHGISGASAQALSEALISTALLASPMKMEEKYALSIHGRGMMRLINTDIDHLGNIRGYIRTSPENEWPAGVTASDLMAPPGIMQITRSVPGKVVYQGITEFRLGAIGADIALHVSTSDQVETEVRVMFEAGKPVAAAGGLSVQALPGTSLDLFVPLRHKLDEYERRGWSTELIDHPEKLVAEVLADFNPTVLDIAPVRFQCNCSRERVENIFRQLPYEDLLSLLDPDGSAVAHCHWCNAEYLFSPGEMSVYTVGIREKGELPN